MLHTPAKETGNAACLHQITSTFMALHWFTTILIFILTNLHQLFIYQLPGWTFSMFYLLHLLNILHTTALYKKVCIFIYIRTYSNLMPVHLKRIETVAILNNATDHGLAGTRGWIKGKPGVHLPPQSHYYCERSFNIITTASFSRPHYQQAPY
jgi:hypothetical protein